MASRRFKPPVRILCTLGTLAHNRAFKPREISEYIRFEPGGFQMQAKVRPTVAWLKKHKLVKAGDTKGTLYPTAKGWNMIEKACRR